MAFTKHTATRESKRATGSKRHTLFSITSPNPSVLFDTNWGGGSRHQYAIINETGKRSIPAGVMAAHGTTWNSGPGTVPDRWPIPVGTVVFRGGTFRGKPAVPALIGRPEDVEKLLTAWGVQE